MSACVLCPRNCNVDRSVSRGYCGASTRANIARAALHFYEEPPISGTRGSGAVFFSGCNLNCIFCQNHEINHSLVGGEYDSCGLAGIMLRLEAAGAHNINLVTAAPHVPLVANAILDARGRGLKIPIVYNTNGYEKVDALKQLRGLVDIYLPDLKYVSAIVAKRYSGAEDYFPVAAAAIDEMYAQTGPLDVSAEGIARRGVLLRHLVLPCSVDEARRVMDFIVSSYGKDAYLSLMSQYTPCGSKLPKPLSRRLLPREYDRAVEYALLLGMTNVFTQGFASADRAFTPDFDGSVI